MLESHPEPFHAHSDRLVHGSTSSRSSDDAAAPPFSARDFRSGSEGSTNCAISAGFHLRNCSSGGQSSHLAELAEVFELMDRDGDGRISCDELAALLRTTGEASGEEDTEAAVRAMMAQADADGDGTIDFDEFVRVNAAAAADAAAAALDPESAEAAAAVQQEELQSVFAFFDRDGDGVITAEELCRVLCALWGPGEDVTMEECERIVRAADGNGDGVVDLEEFARVMAGSALIPAPLAWPA